MGRVEKLMVDNIDDVRCFEIRDLNREGSGCCYGCFVTKDTPVDEIMDIACDIVNTDKNDSLVEQDWRSTIKVVEVVNKFVKPLKLSGRTHRIGYRIKRGGLKFTLERSRLKVKYADGSVVVSEQYVAGRVL